MKKALIELLKKEVKPAMGCTEPVAVTLAAAKAREIANYNFYDSIEIEVSANIYKNGLAVGIPKSDAVGIAIAGAIGVVAGDSELSLKIYESIEVEAVDFAKNLLNKVHVSIADLDEKVYVSVTLKQGNRKTTVVLQGLHNHFAYIIKEGVVILNEPLKVKENDFDIRLLSIEEIITTVEEASFEELSFLLEGLEMNKKISELGQKEKLGIGVGFSFKKSVDEGILGDDLVNKSMIYTAAASDARMSGVSFPVMSSNGSGNNGLTAILPILAYKDQKNPSDEALVKALGMSHLLNCYIKAEIGRLSALCSCGISAATGAGAAITWLMGGTHDEISGTISNMIANLSGMICDGAKNSCALKLATAAATGIKASILSMNGTVAPAYDGIIGRNAEESIKNLGILSREGMQLTDETILKTMQGMQK